MKRTLILILLPFIIIGLLFFVVSQKACDWAMNFQAEKTVPFNHKAHLTEYDADGCETCHGFYENGQFKGIPTIGTCNDLCHDGDTASELEQFANLKQDYKSWEAFAKQPDLVFFSHKVVLASPKAVGCASCHGDKENSTTTDKIKGKMKMGECMDCHKSLKISNKCAICHD